MKNWLGTRLTRSNSFFLHVRTRFNMFVYVSTCSYTFQHVRIRLNMFVYISTCSSYTFQHVSTRFITCWLVYATSSLVLAVMVVLVPTHADNTSAGSVAAGLLSAVTSPRYPFTHLNVLESRHRCPPLIHHPPPPDGSSRGLTTTWTTPPRAVLRSPARSGRRRLGATEPSGPWLCSTLRRCVVAVQHLV